MDVKLLVASAGLAEDTDRRPVGGVAGDTKVEWNWWTGGGQPESLDVVDEWREDDKSDDEKEDEQAELVGAGSERLNEDLQSGRMNGQLEQAQYTHDADELQQFAACTNTIQYKWFSHRSNHRILT